MKIGAMVIKQNNDLDNFLSDTEGVFSITVSDARKIIEAFHQEMKLGLAGMESSLKMLPSFVNLPTGTEKGRYLVLDLGGTNIRIMVVELDGRGNTAVPAVSRFVIPKEAMCGAGEELFSFIADCIGMFIEKHGIGGQAAHSLAFTFSFPIEQRSLASGILI